MKIFDTKRKQIILLALSNSIFKFPYTFYNAFYFTYNFLYFINCYNKYHEGTSKNEKDNVMFQELSEDDSYIHKTILKHNLEVFPETRTEQI